MDLAAVPKTYAGKLVFHQHLLGKVRLEEKPEEQFGTLTSKRYNLFVDNLFRCPYLFDISSLSE